MLLLQLLLLEGVEISVGAGGGGLGDFDLVKRNGNEWCSLLGEVDVLALALALVLLVV